LSSKGIVASRGILMAAIPPQVVFAVLAAVDSVKIGLLRKLPQGL
jgi:TRAP-type C4-dicarboxylate transport system permease large subunit